MCVVGRILSGSDFGDIEIKGGNKREGQTSQGRE